MIFFNTVITLLRLSGLLETENQLPDDFQRGVSDLNEIPSLQVITLNLKIPFKEKNSINQVNYSSCFRTKHLAQWGICFQTISGIPSEKLPSAKKSQNCSFISTQVTQINLKGFPIDVITWVRHIKASFDIYLDINKDTIHIIKARKM